jgi:hypothetical protein
MDQHRCITPITKRQKPKNASRALKKFTLFPKLPPELRDMTWNIAAPGEFKPCSATLQSAIHYQVDAHVHQLS